MTERKNYPFQNNPAFQKRARSEWKLRDFAAYAISYDVTGHDAMVPPDIATESCWVELSVPEVLRVQIKIKQDLQAFISVPSQA